MIQRPQIRTTIENNVLTLIFSSNKASHNLAYFLLKVLRKSGVKCKCCADIKKEQFITKMVIEGYTDE